MDFHLWNLWRLINFYLVSGLYMCKNCTMYPGSLKRTSEDSRIGFHLMSSCIMLTMKLIDLHFFAHDCTVQGQQTLGKMISCLRVFRELWKRLRQKWPWPSPLACKLGTVGALPNNLVCRMALSS